MIVMYRLLNVFLLNPYDGIYLPVRNSKEQQPVTQEVCTSGYSRGWWTGGMAVAEAMVYGFVASGLWVCW
ncbi:hypothetical protein POPTR_001G060750v4 [Populus trichocarpa]|uniref:Uncharacterized protein n=1 Tax=Populus trichocarpa TaxID=3694 RepID=A0A3N7E7M2_POPTR|nr:hypothetical protein BDE02_01G055700 [Populus trichocarpa]RQO84463.1 hypothetical protein POPTR_001G060750v4 [Populus trichocarpa]